jgi:2-desacetyl-2-hydroxyethyl bacteriochlorophyllide A dehydrogenase
MKAHAIQFTAPNEVALGPIELPDPVAGEVLVEADYTAVSPGTELRCLAGKQAGLGPWPIIPGYQMSGRVIQAANDSKFKKGDAVFCMGTQKANISRGWGGHCSHAVVNEGSVWAIPNHVDKLEATIVKLAAICYHGVCLSKPVAHETVVVVGLGPIGQIAARVHALSGARVVAVDVSPERVEFTKKAGIEAIVAQPNLIDAVKAVFPDGADIVVDSTGSPAVLKMSAELCKKRPWDDTPQQGPRLMIQGSYPDLFEVSYRATFSAEATILVPRDHQHRDLRHSMDLLSRGKLKLRDLISDVRTPDSAPKTYKELAENKGGVLTVAFKWK